MKKMAIGASLTMLSCIACAETITTPLYLPPLSSSEIKQKEPSWRDHVDFFVGIGITPIFSTNVEFFKDKESMDSRTRGNFQVGAFLSEQDSKSLYMVRLAFSKIDFEKHVADMYNSESIYVYGSMFYADFALGEKSDENTKFYYGLGIGYIRKTNKWEDASPYPSLIGWERHTLCTGRAFVGIDYKVVNGLHLFAEPMVYSINKSFKSPSIAVNVGGRIVF